MKTIRSQAALRTVLMLFGVGIGVISTLFIYPLDLEFFGLLQFVVAFSLFAGPLMGMGVIHMGVKFFQDNELKANGRGFFMFTFLYALLSYGIVLATCYLARDQLSYLLNLGGFDVPRLSEFSFIIALLSLVVLLIAWIEKYITNLGEVVVPTIANNLIQKILVPLAVVLVVFFDMPILWALWLYLGARFLVLVYLLLYTSLRRGFFQSRLRATEILGYGRKDVRAMATYGAWSALGAIGMVLAFRVDIIMVGGMIDYRSAGIYSIGFFVANILSIPMASLNSLVGAKISYHFSSDNLIKIKDLYQRSSDISFIVSVGLLLLVWFNLKDIFLLTPNSESLLLSAPVVLYLGLSKVVNGVTGVNQAILIYSSRYRWNLVLILLMGFVTVCTNLLLIPRMGITGAALATLLSLTVFNVVKFFFIWYLFKMQPFSRASLYILLLGILTAVILIYLKLELNPFVNIIVRSTVIFLLFAFPVYYFNISIDISRAVDKYLNLLKKRFT